MKENELRKHLKCSCCDKPIAHTGLPIFWKVTVERHGIDTTAVARQQGLSVFIGSPQLANVMGPDEDMTVELMEPREITLCDECAVKIPVAIVLERT